MRSRYDHARHRPGARPGLSRAAHWWRALPGTRRWAAGALLGLAGVLVLAGLTAAGGRASGGPAWPGRRRGCPGGRRGGRPGRRPPGCRRHRSPQRGAGCSRRLRSGRRRPRTGRPRGGYEGRLPAHLVPVGGPHRRLHLAGPDLARQPARGRAAARRSVPRRRRPARPHRCLRRPVDRRETARPGERVPGGQRLVGGRRTGAAGSSPSAPMTSPTCRPGRLSA